MMSLAWRLYNYIIALHLIFFTFTLHLFSSQPALFVVLELLLLMSLAGGCYLVRLALQPLSYVRHFGELIQDKNYAARLQLGKQADLNELIKLFNQMLNALYQERLKLGEQQGFLDRLLEATPSAVLVFDFDQRISLVNASAQSLLPMCQLQGKTLEQLAQQLGEKAAAQLTPASEPSQTELAKQLQQQALSLISQLVELPLSEGRLLHDSQERRFRCLRGQFIDRGFTRDFLIIDEITHELEIHEKATYEKLVRVLAHEVNNTVAATGSVLESLLFYQTQLNSADRSDFCTAIDAVIRRNSRLAEFIERFTRVVKMPDPELQQTVLSDIITPVVSLFREQCKLRQIKLEWSAPESLPLVRIDSSLFEQALINILKNALEAVQSSMLENNQLVGLIQVRLSTENHQLRLTITDSGNRLAEVPPGQLFSPFFSTKKGGQGIGLLFVREVLLRHGFKYRLFSSQQAQTQFDIWLGF